MNIHSNVENFEEQRLSDHNRSIDDNGSSYSHPESDTASSDKQQQQQESINTNEQHESFGEIKRVMKEKEESFEEEVKVTSTTISKGEAAAAVSNEYSHGDNDDAANYDNKKGELSENEDIIDAIDYALSSDDDHVGNDNDVDSQDQSENNGREETKIDYDDEESPEEEEQVIHYHPYHHDMHSIHDYPTDYSDSSTTVEAGNTTESTYIGTDDDDDEPPAFNNEYLNQVIRDAISSKPSTYLPKKYDQLPSCRTIKPEGRARRASKARLKLEKFHRKTGGLQRNTYEEREQFFLEHDPAALLPPERKPHHQDPPDDSNSDFDFERGISTTKSTQTRSFGEDDSMESSSKGGYIPDGMFTSSRVLTSLPDDIKKRYESLTSSGHGGDSSHDRSKALLSLKDQAAGKSFRDGDDIRASAHKRLQQLQASRDHPKEPEGTKRVGKKNTNNTGGMFRRAFDRKTSLDNDIMTHEDDERAWKIARDSVFGIEDKSAVNSPYDGNRSDPRFSISDHGRHDHEHEHGEEQDRDNSNYDSRRRNNNDDVLIIEEEDVVKGKDEKYSHEHVNKLISNVKQYSDKLRVSSKVREERINSYDIDDKEGRDKSLMKCSKKKKLCIGSFLYAIYFVISSIIVLLLLSVGRNGFSSNDDDIDLTFPRFIPPRPETVIPPEFDSNYVHEITAGGAPTSSYYTSEDVLSLVGLSGLPSEDPNTPRSKALRWIFQDVVDNRELGKNGLFSSMRIQQRYALATFYYSTQNNTHKWNNDDNWLSMKHECTWFGLRCGPPSDDDNDGSKEEDSRYLRSNSRRTAAGGTGAITIFDHSVTCLKLDDNNLCGTIPNEISLLDYLSQTHLQDNIIHGSLPNDIVKLSLLHTIYLDNNRLTEGLPATTELSQLSNLVNLDISTNSLNTEVGSYIGLLSSLAYLRLDNNHLKGTLPNELANLNDLEVFMINNNLLTSTIPNQFGELDNLQVIHMHANQLSGQLPAFKSSTISTVYLDDNKFTGVVPLFSDEDDTLVELRLQNNNITGNLPRHMSNMHNIEVLWLDNNDISGTIPHEWGKLGLLKSLRLNGNSFNGIIPQSICFLKTNRDLTNLQVTTNKTNPDVTCTCCDDNKRETRV